MFKFIHAADIHLDSPLKGLESYEGAPVELIRGATRKALKNLVSLALSEEVEFVIISGDLFDGDWKDYNTGLFFTSQMTRLREAGIKVYIISGNHDAQSKITRALRMPDNIKLFSTKKPETVPLDSLGVVIHGQGFPRPVVNDNLATTYPQAIKGMFNIGILHTCAIGCAGHEPYAPCTKEDLLSKGYDYWALGHIHKRQVLHESPWIVFSGNIQGRHVKEPGDKGCTIVTVDNGEIVDAEHRQLDILRWAVKDIDVSHAVTGYDVLDTVSAQVIKEMETSNDRPLAMRLYITGSCEAHKKLMKQPQKWLNDIRQSTTDVSGSSVWLEKVFIQTRAKMDLKALIERDDSLGGLLRYINTLSLDEKEMEELMKNFSDLNRKLTPALKTSLDELVERNSSEKLSTLVEDVRQLLLARLLSSGDGS